LSLLSGLIGTSIAHRIFKGFHGDLSALAIATSALASWACTRSLGKWLINRQKRIILASREQTLLQNTPTGHLYHCLLSPKQPINFCTLGELLIAQKIMGHIDSPTLTRMHNYWDKHSIPSAILLTNPQVQSYEIVAPPINTIAES
jgi:hypothetical protein